MQEDLNNSNLWLCKNKKCGKQLGELIDKNKIEILGARGLFEIGFLYIEIVCDCGEKNYIQSEFLSRISSIILKEWPRKKIPLNKIIDLNLLLEIAPKRKRFFQLSRYHRKLLFKKLTETQKKTFLILGKMSGEEIKMASKIISKEIGLPKLKVRKDIVKIIEEILLLKGILKP